MQNIKKFVVISFLTIFSSLVFAQPTATELSVWVNEAIVSAYTYDYQNFLDQQKKLAHYFTAQGWIDFTTAITKAKLPETIASNQYFVSTVALLPPSIKQLRPDVWEGKMPVLTLYKNPQYQQKQTQEITIQFQAVSTEQGVRGLAIMSLQSTIIAPPCECTTGKLEPDPTTPAVKN
jgi:hypothetical protein